MSRNEMHAKIELLNRYEAMIAELKEQADKIRDDIKAEMLAQDTETMIVGQYIVRWTDVLSNRFDRLSNRNELVGERSRTERIRE